METSLAKISKQIYLVRNTRVMLDFELAGYYQVQTRTLNQKVRRHSKKFPEEFMFQVTKDEFENLRPQIVASDTENRGGRQKLPLAFTEQGVGMLSCIMNSDVSVEFSFLVIQAFVQLRQISDGQAMMVKKLDHLEFSFQEMKQTLSQVENKMDSFLGSTKSFEQSLNIQTVLTSTKRPILFTDRNKLTEIDAILARVTSYFNLKVNELKSTTRRKSVVVPRQIAIYLVRKRTEIGFKEIGKCFGGQDHTTVLHSYKKIRDSISKDDLIRDAVAEIEKSLSN